ncbi:hypothetical protein NL374_27170, partial [Klebsiella pneumoniae]|nr:hypothetical protein [Klebsiella pneumoniae]
YLFTPEGMVRPAPMKVSALETVIQHHRQALLSATMTAFQQGWPAADADVVSQVSVEATIDGLSAELQVVVDRLFQRLQWALNQLERLRKVASAK